MTTKKKKAPAKRKPKVSPTNRSLFDEQDNRDLSGYLEDKRAGDRPAKRGGNARYPD